MKSLFLVCLIPPVSIAEDIDEIRKDCSSKYNVYESLRRPAHITLYEPLSISEHQERDFHAALKTASNLESFCLILRNFGSFPPHTVYIGVEKNAGLMKLHAQIKNQLDPLIKGIHSNRKAGYNFNPHLTVAFKDIQANVFPKINEEFKERNFKREFFVTGFSVLKHDGQAWQPYKEYLFQLIERSKPLGLFD